MVGACAIADGQPVAWPHAQHGTHVMDVITAQDHRRISRLDDQFSKKSRHNCPRSALSGVRICFRIRSIIPPAA
jgi:hypothetical protein